MNRNEVNEKREKNPQANILQEFTIYCPFCGARVVLRKMERKYCGGCYDSLIKLTERGEVQAYRVTEIKSDKGE